MDIVNRLNILLQEASGTSGSTEMGFNTWWNRPNQIYINQRDNRVLWSNDPQNPTGTTMDNTSIDSAKNRGYIVVPRQKYTSA